MKIPKAKNILQALDVESAHPEEKKVFKQLLELLAELDSHELSKQDLAIIEEHLERMLREAPYSGRLLKRGLKALKKTLTHTMSFIAVNYFYTLGAGLGLAMGSVLGGTFGIVFNNPLGLVYGAIWGATIGTIGGFIVGKYLDQKAGVENRVLVSL